MLLYTRVAPPKVPKRRSRAGCNFCKEKKKKCDEARPRCTRCEENGHECRYDPVKPRQRRRADQQQAAELGQQYQQPDDDDGVDDGVDNDGGQGGGGSGGANHADGQQGSAGAAAAGIGTVRPSRAGTPQRAAHRPPPLSLTTAGLARQHRQRAAAAPLCHARGGSSSSDASPDTASDDWPQSAATAVAGQPNNPLHHHRPYAAPTTDSAVSSAAPYTPCTDFGAFSFDPFDASIILPPNDGTVGHDDDGDVSPTIANDFAGFSPDASSPAAASPTSSRSLTLVPPSPRLEFTAPAFYEFSHDAGRRNLIAHFCNTLSHLIVLREDEGNNPFQQLVLPLSHGSQAVTGAIYALASAHLEVRGVDPGGAHASVRYHSQAIQGLARLIEQGDGVDRNELLAAIMLLIYYEVLVQRGRSNLVDGHLKGAMAIMGNGSPQNNPTGVFLERAFRFYDVIAALSFGTAPLSNCPSSGGFTPFAPLDSRGTTVAYDSVDALLGMATSLWPVIHRLSNLLAMKNELTAAVTAGELSKAAVLRAEFDSTCAAIEFALQEWEPILPQVLQQQQQQQRCPDEEDKAMDEERCRLQSILNSALAYRHSAFVYLYRSIYDCPREHPVVQLHTHVSLTHCEATVAHGGPMGSLLWPLFVSACEAMEPADRALARRSFAGISRRQGMKNIERAWCVVEEVWLRADAQQNTAAAAAAAADQEEENMGFFKMPPATKRRGDLWRKVSADMGWTIVFG
ncbi:hypothetical protein JDV02_010438 [Purpureocillium takamizusanense]|uniref:Zn(2)-C6 fungal-type domain-containing protein n=1 Tax=Purpureocillium takamizusanense TaxID=2060973 RepID=A0A9Q8VGL8_9HYPO|nr:uncharacterized protein JDV02_010438 [Purpureocillium takamizusanense]UNI24711.1 hypothetical protein JDV02_010438 [Purpureocillium takamizusanense]